MQETETITLIKKVTLPLVAFAVTTTPAFAQDAGQPPPELMGTELGSLGRRDREVA